jgi:hypothetical protein
MPTRSTRVKTRPLPVACPCLKAFRPWWAWPVTRTVQTMEQNPPQRPLVLLLEDFIDVPCQPEEIRRRCALDHSWLTALANSASTDGEALLMRIGPSWAAGLLTRTVRIRLGPARERGSTVVVPIDWESAEHPNLFPVLSGDLEITPLGWDVCRIVLSASYSPPLGELGRRIDRAVLHHVAQSTVRSFLSRMATSLGQESGAEAHMDEPAQHEVPFRLAPGQGI